MLDDYTREEYNDNEAEAYEKILEIQKKIRLRKARAKRRRKISLAVLLTFVLAVGVFFFLRSSKFYIKTVNFKGGSVIKKADICQAAGITEGTSLVFLKKEDFLSGFKNDVYLKSIEIIKKYPDELTIKIKEREPILALPEKTNSNSLRRKKKYYLMAEDGVILEKSSPRKNFTEISKSLINDDQKVGRYIGLKDKIERKELLDILSSMKIGNIFYKKIDLDKGNLIAYVNDKLVIKGEIKAVVKAAKSKKLSKILFDLYKKKKMEGTIILSDNEYSVYSPQTYKEVKVKE